MTGSRRRWTGIALDAGLWRTTPVRLSVIWGAAYAVGLVLLLGAVWVSTEEALTRRSDGVLMGELAYLERGGPETVLGRFRSEGARDPLDRFALFSATGQRVAGDSPLGPPTTPVDGRPHDAPPVRGEAPSRVVAGRARWGEILVVQRDTSQIADLRRIILAALCAAGAVIAGLGLAGGAFLGARPLRRIRAIRAASEAIAGGDFTRRLPVSGSGDEIDALATIANAMMDEAERLMAQARTVGEGVAHELRSPLTRLRARLEHAAQELDEADPRRDLIEGCVAEAEGVLARFRALLRIAALEARGRRVGLVPTPLSPLIEHAAELFTPLAAERGIALDATCEAGLAIEADGELMFEALCNLLDNALKFTPKGGRVRLAARRDAEATVIEVADDGPGIDPAERALVTKRFYRSGRHAGIEGHGLGLSLVAAVADLHGMTLAFEDAGPGVRVRLVGPRV